MIQIKGIESVERALSDKNLSTDRNWAANHLRQLSSHTDPALLSDMIDRFGLFDTRGRRMRLIFLDQHVETRQPWCETTIPFLVGLDFDATWPAIAESVWGYRPVKKDAGFQKLVDWYDGAIQKQSVVLSIEPNSIYHEGSWPPDTDGKQQDGWQRVHTESSRFPFRCVSAGQLANLMHVRNISAIHLFQPSFGRYVLLSGSEDPPVVAYQSSAPGRFLKSLNRLESSIVRN